MTTYTRKFNEGRRVQGFRSQAHLDAFYRHYDHVKGCTDCTERNSYVDLSDGVQPTQGECPHAQALYRAYLVACEPVPEYASAETAYGQTVAYPFTIRVF